MSTIHIESLSLLFFEKIAIFNFKVIWSDLRSKVMAPNESPYMISYMSTIHIESLSLIFLEKIAIFTFKVIWSDLRSKVMALNESPYMISYVSIIQMESLSIIVSEIIGKNCIFDLSRSSRGQGH